MNVTPPCPPASPASSQSRNTMSLGYTDPASGEFRKASSVQLRNTMRVSDDEATRKACYEVCVWRGEGGGQ